MGIVNNIYHNHTTEIPAIGPVHMTEEAILQLIISLRPSKTLGVDWLHPRLLSSLVDTISGPLTILFNMSLPYTQFHGDWKDAIVIPIFSSVMATSPSIQIL